MDSIEIKSAKIKNTLFLDFSYTKKEGVKTDDINQSSDLPFHEDCKQAFLNLLPHFLLICEQEKESKLKKLIKSDTISQEDETLQNYEITAFKIGGTGDSEGVTLTGKKFLGTGKTLNLNTPFLRFDDEDYRYGMELIEAIEVLKTEVYQYMTGAKHAPIAQQSMSFDEAFDGEEEDPVENAKETFKDLKKKGYKIEVSTSEDAA